MASPLSHRVIDLQSYVEPDNISNNTTTVVARPNKPGKLRQTCDTCSEAKVKCDKGNPRCGRCERLSYECVYSPARRIGRPRPRSPRSQDSGRPARDDGAVTDDANKDCKAPPPSARPAEQTRTKTQTPTATDLLVNGDLNLNEPLLVCLSNGTDRWSAPSSVSDSASSNARSNEGPQSTSMRDGPLSSVELGVDEARHNPYDYDCATVAVATLRKLAVAGLEGQSPAQTTAAADVLADQIPHACRQAARILVCPCSADMDTALLAASLAAAILEVADAALRILKPAGHALDDEQHTVLALGILPNISQVVTLFTHRYSVTQASRPPEALLLLAASLRTTLKAMAEETTNRFLDSGAAPSRMEVAAGGCV